jgi:hypothetical protein
MVLEKLVGCADDPDGLNQRPVAVKDLEYLAMASGKPLLQCCEICRI